MSNPITPGISIDLVATLRQVCGTRFPDPMYAAKIAVTDDLLAYACDFEAEDFPRVLKTTNGELRRFMLATRPMVL